MEMNREDALAYIHETAWQNQTPGLERMCTLLHALGDPQKQLRFVHVAGTNGKGSTCACMASILRAAGLRVGLNTSPYIHRFNERIQVNGVEIPDEALVSLVERSRRVVEALPFRPTEFEWITAIAMLHFLEERCDIVVLEVGLGGEFDASNVIDSPEVAVIVALGYDHTAILGHTMADIATAKAGIVKAGCPVVYEGGDETGRRVIASRCSALNAPLTLVDMGRILSMEGGFLAPVLTVEPYGKLPFGLAGDYQPRNAMVAVTAMEILAKQGWNITPAHIAQGLSAVRWPGRFQVLSRLPLVILDGAHNPQGMGAMAETLARELPGAPLQVVLGLLADKDVGEMLELVKSFASVVHCVTPPSPRALESAALAKQLTAMGVTAHSYKTVSAALDAAAAAVEPTGAVVALGSLYLCSDVIEWANK